MRWLTIVGDNRWSTTAATHPGTGEILATADGISVLVDGAAARIRVGRKSLALNVDELRRVFAALHAMNIHTEGNALGEPAFYTLEKDTGVPF